MRACEGCRRRKIKCDAATTNSWPCAACIRLKLNCVPPTVSYDKDYNANTQTFELETKPLEYASPVDGHPQYQRHSIGAIPQGLHQQMPPPLQSPASATYASDGIRMYQNPPYVEQQPQEHIQYSPLSQPQVLQQNIAYPPQQMYSETPTSAHPGNMSPPATEGSWRNDSISSVTTLSDALGELKIDHTAVGEPCLFLDLCPISDYSSALHYESEENTSRSSGSRRIRSATARVQ